MNWSFITDNVAQAIGVGLLVLAFLLVLGAKRQKFGDALTTLGIVLIAAVIGGLGGVFVAFGGAIAARLFGAA